MIGQVALKEPRRDMADHEVPDDDLLGWLARRTARVTADETVTGLVSAALERHHGGRWDWWAVTELVNPAQTFWRRTEPDVEADPAIRVRLDYGSRIHDLASSWFRRLPGYAAAEGSVDGAPAGIAGVKGRIDFRMGRCIVELKTTELHFDAPEHVLAHNPQDVEQLVLYALMTFRESEPHKLVYFNENVPGVFIAYTVRIRAPGPLKQYFLARRGALERALEIRDPRKLGQCRYFGTGCDYKLNGICHCASLRPLDTRTLSDSLEMVRDPALEADLRHSRESAPVLTADRLNLWDLFVPRRAFLRATEESVEYSAPDETYELRKILERRFVASESSSEPFDLVLKLRADQQVKLLGRSLGVKLRETTANGPVEVSVPFLLRVSKKSSPHEPAEIPDVYKAQLGAHCAIRSSNTGVLAIIYPNLDAQSKCFRLRFDGLEEIRLRLSKRLTQLEGSISSVNAESLPPCPEWLRARCGARCLCVSAAS